jgi:hypothetical protein
MNGLLRIGLTILVSGAVVFAAAVAAGTQQLECTSRTLLAAPCWEILFRAFWVGASAFMFGIVGLVVTLIAWITGRRGDQPA